jgi:hypothetical protein
VFEEPSVLGSLVSGCLKSAQHCLQIALLNGLGGCYLPIGF